MRILIIIGLLLQFSSQDLVASQNPLTPQQIQAMLPSGCCGCYHYWFDTNYLYANCYNPAYYKGASAKECSSSKLEFEKCSLPYNITVNSESGFLQCSLSSGGVVYADYAENGSPDCGPPDDCSGICYDSNSGYNPPSLSVSKPYQQSPMSAPIQQPAKKQQSK
ncbi:MAG: hypothetical protein JSR85_01160 [Proteobacteria bacterium]|nr:hypothetical protein [Pseudomonadota bacterium]